MFDCVVVGGGLIGLLTARELKLAGMNVAVVERGKLGGESSWAGGGIISPLYPWRYSDAVNVLAEKSKQLYPSLRDQLIAESGVDSELIRSGILITHDDEIETAQHWAQRYKVTIEHLLSAQQLAEVSPGVHADFSRGLWMPEIMQIRNPKFVQALRGSCKFLNIPYYEHAEVQQLIVDKNNVKGLQLTDKKLLADNVVVASGAWSAKLLQQLVSVDVSPVKGQMIMLKTKPVTVKTIVMSQGHYIIPRCDGRVLCGSTLEHTDFDKTVSGQTREQLVQYAQQLMPGLANYPVERHWAGLRPGTRQGIPYVCRHEHITGLFVHAGHYRNGIVLGAASALLMAQIVTQQQTWCDASPYALSAEH